MVRHRIVKLEMNSNFMCKYVCSTIITVFQLKISNFLTCFHGETCHLVQGARVQGWVKAALGGDP